MNKPEKIGKSGALYNGDCLDVLKTFPSNSITSIISDPPAGINFMGSKWDQDKGGRTEWIAWLSEIMKECLRVIKPGGMIAIWSIPRTSHWTMTAIEDAGFTLRSKIYHHFGSGFPKSSSIPKFIDRKLGKERKIIGKREHPTLKDKSKVDRQNSMQYHGENPIADEWELTESNSDEAKLFDGYGTATKPSTEEWLIAQKDLTTVSNSDIIPFLNHLVGEILCQLLSNVNNVERFFLLSQAECEGVSVFAIINAGLLHSVSSPGLYEKMVTSNLQGEVLVCLNIVLLWSNILTECSQMENKSTTKTKIEVITELKILSCLLLAIIPDYITKERYLVNGSQYNVKRVENGLKEIKERLKTIQKHSAQRNAISNMENTISHVNGVDANLHTIDQTVCTALNHVLQKLIWQNGRTELQGIVNFVEKNSILLNQDQGFIAVNNAWQKVIKNEAPSTEEWILAMAPLDGSFAENALKHGLAGINIAASRIAGPMGPDRSLGKPRRTDNTKYGKSNDTINPQSSDGRWPADLILQHHKECMLVGSKKVKGIQTTNYGKHKTQPGASGTMGDGWDGDKIVQGYADKDGNETIEDWKCHPQCPIRIIGEQSGVRKSGDNCVRTKEGFFFEHGGMGKAGDVQITYGDKGTAARFFLNLPADPGFLYCAKPSPKERNHGCEDLPAVECQTGCGGAMPIDDDGKERDCFKKVATNFHPTCKPLKLMKYLAVLLAPPQDPLILDMFAGSGTTGVACEQLGIPFILIEKEAVYCDIIKARVNAANTPMQKKKTEKVKSKKQKQQGFFDLEKEGFL